MNKSQHKPKNFSEALERNYYSRIMELLKTSRSLNLTEICRVLRINKGQASVALANLVNSGEIQSFCGQDDKAPQTYTILEPVFIARPGPFTPRTNEILSFIKRNNVTEIQLCHQYNLTRADVMLELSRVYHAGFISWIAVGGLFIYKHKYKDPLS